MMKDQLVMSGVFHVQDRIYGTPYGHAVVIQLIRFFGVEFTALSFA